MTTDTHLDLSVLVDLQAAPPCTVYRPGCDRAATWRLRVLHLDGALCVVFLACDPHHDRLVEVLSQPGRLAACRDHGVEVRDDWTRL